MPGLGFQALSLTENPLWPVDRDAGPGAVGGGVAVMVRRRQVRRARGRDAGDREDHARVVVVCPREPAALHRARTAETGCARELSSVGIAGAPCAGHRGVGYEAFALVVHGNQHPGPPPATTEGFGAAVKPANVNSVKGSR